jgi:hypothetical protein
VGAQKNTLQFRVDILNVGNLLNNKWGVAYASTTSNPLTIANNTATTAGTPTYRLATQVINGSTELLRDSYVKAINVNNVWQAQIGLRYIFN